MMQEYMRESCETLGWTQEQAEMMECGIRWAVEERRKGRGAEKGQRRQEEQEQRRHGEQGQDSGQEQSKCVSSLVQGGRGWTDMMSWTRHAVKARVKEWRQMRARGKRKRSRRRKRQEQGRKVHMGERGGAGDKDVPREG